jgi:hypothetical protein
MEKTKENEDSSRSTHRSSDINQRRPSSLIPILLRQWMTPSQPSSSISSAHKRPSNVRAELDGDAEGDDEVDEGDCVEGDVPDAHDAHDVEDGEGADEGDDGARSPGAEEEGGHKEDGDEGEGENLEGDWDDVGVLSRKGRKRYQRPRDQSRAKSGESSTYLIKEDVEERVRVDLRPRPHFQIVRYPPRRGQRVDKVGLRLERRMVRPEMRSDDRRVIARQRDRVSIRALPSQRTLLVRRALHPLPQVPHELWPLRQSLHCDIPRRLLPLEARPTPPLRLIRSTEDGRVVPTDSAASFEDGVEPAEEVIEPDGWGVSEEGDVGSFALGFEGVAEGKRVGRRR